MKPKTSNTPVSLLKTRVELMTGIILFNSSYPCFSFRPDFITIGMVPRMIKQKMGKTPMTTATIVTPVSYTHLTLPTTPYV